MRVIVAILLYGGLVVASFAFGALAASAAKKSFNPGGDVAKIGLVVGAPFVAQSVYRMLFGAPVGALPGQTVSMSQAAFLLMAMGLQAVAFLLGTRQVSGGAVASAGAWLLPRGLRAGPEAPSITTRVIWFGLAAVPALGVAFPGAMANMGQVLLVAGLVLFMAKSALSGGSVVKLRPDLLSSKEILAAVTAALPKQGVFAGELAGPGRDAPPSPVKVGIDDRACVVGPPGTGKTAFLVTQLLDWAESGESFVCLDIKPEIFGIVRDRLEAKGYQLLTYNPTARTGQRYNPLDDADTPEAIGELTAALIPSTESDAKVFDENARDLLDGIVSHLRATMGRASLPDVAEFLASFDDVKGLLRELRQSPDADVKGIAAALAMSAQNERMLGSIFAALRSNLRFLRYPAIRDSLASSDFSLADLAKPKVGLFLQFEETSAAITRGLFCAMVAHLMRYFIAHANRRPVLLLLDEIGNVPAVPGLAQKLNTIRSRSLPTWLYWQSTAQMEPYAAGGDSGAMKILGACDLQMVFRLNDNASAEWMSERIGTVDRVVKAVSITHSEESIFGATTRSASLVHEPVIRPHELQQLKPGETVCTWRGLAWRGLATPFYARFADMRGEDKKPRGEQLRGAPYQAGSS